MSGGNFRVYSTAISSEKLSFYFVESTAPDSVELRDTVFDVPPGLKLIDDPDDAVSQIAELLVPQDEPDANANLVVMVHGYNNRRESVLDFYRSAVDALTQNEAAICKDPKRRIVCIGYRWPSERIFSVFPTSLNALPRFTSRLLWLAVAFIALELFGWIVGDNLPLWLSRLATFVPAAVIGVTVVVALLRAVVYFRDIYRATNYGVPDLVEVIRLIDRKVSGIVEKRREAPRPRIALSFIGHSMGGLVVTNVIRVLSDVFDRDMIRTGLSGDRIPGTAADRPDGLDVVPGRIGHVFTLMRFVLASPDIPAETLLADRANFLASSLRRFREAYLFSSEGDDVLRLVSTTANYFSFPTVSRDYGYRLGNAEILSQGFGVQPNTDLLNSLRAGWKTLAALSEDTTRQTAPGAARTDPAQVASAFTYFDCTDYIDTPQNGDGKRRGLLTRARNFKADDAKGRIPNWEHVRLLLQSFLNKKWFRNKIDVHGGYFEGPLTRRLIFVLACIGFDDTKEAFPDVLHECKDAQIRVILSDRLDRRSLAPPDPREKMATADGFKHAVEALQAENESLRSTIDLLRAAGPKTGEETPTLIDTGDRLEIDGVSIPKKKPEAP
jgi:hypothetical protein